MKSRPVLIITNKKSLYFNSIKEASEYLNISKQRIQRALESPYGEIPKTRPVICVDEPCSVTDEN